MSLPPIPLDLALIAGRAVFLVFSFILAAITFTRWRRSADWNALQFAEQNATLLSRLATLDQSLAHAHRKLDELREQQEEESRRAAPASASPTYQIAIRLARSGAGRDELMTSCGLTRQEADLILRLHAPHRGPRLAAAS